MSNHLMTTQTGWSFSAKGVIETVKKFGWPPDVVHCHGWMTSLIPLYLKTAYKNEPLFQNAKVVYSIYDESLSNDFNDQFIAKASINNLTEEDLKAYQNGTGVTLHNGGITYSDAVIIGSEEVSESVQNEVDKAAADKAVLPFQGTEGFEAAYLDFYKSLTSEEVEK